MNADLKMMDGDNKLYLKIVGNVLENNKLIYQIYMFFS